MELSDFVKEYNRLYFLRFFDNNWSHTFIRGEWKGESAGGCGNFPTWKNNPQYGFRLPQADEVFITLMQDDVRMNGKIESSINIGFVVLKAPGSSFFPVSSRTRLEQKIGTTERLRCGWPNHFYNLT